MKKQVQVEYEITLSVISTFEVDTESAHDVIQKSRNVLLGVLSKASSIDRAAVLSQKTDRVYMIPRGEE